VLNALKTPRVSKLLVGTVFQIQIKSKSKKFNKFQIKSFKKCVKSKSFFKKTKSKSNPNPIKSNPKNNEKCLFQIL
jgi:hypothetical protein